MVYRCSQHDVVFESESTEYPNYCHADCPRAGDEAQPPEEPLPSESDEPHPEQLPVEENSTEETRPKPKRGRGSYY